MTYALFVLGFFLLVFGAKWLVEGSSGIAKKFGISDFIVGLTIVAMGTSMPELLVNMMASFNGEGEIATGNIIGSNIVNVLLILGITSIICDLPVNRNTVLSEIPFSIAASLLIGFLANSSLWYEPIGELSLSRGDGFIAIFFFILFMAYVFIIAKEESSNLKELAAEVPVKQNSIKNILLVIVGVIALFLGGKWVVDGATDIALSLGFSKTFIGMTIVAIGTSLPELVTTVSAAWKKNTDIAIGNIIGSNLFNLLWILGISSIISPLPFEVTSNIDIGMMILSSTMVLLALIIGRRMTIKRIEGIIFVLTYFAYLYFLVKRG